MAQKKEAETIKPQRRIDVKGTLMNLKVGTPVVIRAKDIKPCSLRSAKRILKDKGYDYHISEAGRIDSAVVTRIK